MGVSIEIPPCRCSVLYQGKKERQKAVATAASSKRPGKPGWYFRVLNCASEKGLSSLTWGRLSERVTPEVGEELRGALAGHGAAPRSECRVSIWGSMPCLRQVCSMSVAASAELSRSATIHPTVYRLKMSSNTYR